MPREEFNERVAEKLQAATAREEASADDTHRLHGEAASRRSWERHAESDEFRERMLAKLDELANRPRPRPMTREEFFEATAGYDEKFVPVGDISAFHEWRDNNNLHLAALITAAPRWLR